MMTNKRLFYYCNFLLPRNAWVLAIALMLLASFNVSAQDKIIKGIVTSIKDATPLPGVNVSVKGSKTGITTSIDGSYSISASSNDILVFSYIGYINQETKVGNRNQINVDLKENLSVLDEVVVVGYGTQKKSNLTGAVSVVNVKDAKKTITSDIGKMLQGQVPGVTVQSSGEPGGFVNIKIRGITSFNNNNPLFVIDGMIVDSPYDFAPGEIETIQVLKDATSAAIYGVRGANGVVIITTKKGKAGVSDVKYKSMYGFQNVPKQWSLTNSKQYQKITSAAEANAGLSIAPGNDPTNALFIRGIDTNWQNEAYRTGTVENHALTFSGGAESLGYSVNIDYFKNKSYLDTPQDYKRLSTTLNLNGRKGKFKYGSKIGYTQSDKENFNEYLPGQSAVSELLLAIPTMPVYDANRLGGYGGATNLTQRAITLNVIGFNHLLQNTNKRNRFIGNLWGELEIVKGLKYKVNASYDRLDWQTRLFNPPSDLGWYYITTNDEAALDLTTGSQTRTIIDNLLTYDLTVNKHKINVLAGWVQENNKHYNHISRGVGYLPGEIGHLEYADAISGREYESTITGVSYLSRVDYSYDDRYLLNANFRQDKSSLFAPENNTGNFYSFSGAWKLSNEKFIKLPKFINSAKLRAGYGELGNNTIGVYGYASTINPFASYALGNSLAPGTTTVTLRDPNVKWETTTTTNVALELGMLNNKLQFTGEYFIKKSTDLLARVPLPLSTGSFPADIVTNAAAVQNKGLEFSLTYSNNDNPFKYSISANLGTLKNEVLQIGTNNLPIIGAASKTEVGRSIGELYGYEAIGIFKDQAEITASPSQTNAHPGDVKFKDVNADGKITDLDRTYQGVTIPKYSYGLNFSSSYKNWDFSMFWQGSGGNKVFDATYRNLMGGQYSNSSTDMLNYWTPTNTNTNVPRPVIGDPNGNGRDSNRFIESGNYIKLQNLQIGYNIPIKANKYIQRAKIYANGQNLLTLTKYRGYDPDFISDGLFSRGYEMGSFPNPRTFAMGVEVDF